MTVDIGQLELELRQLEGVLLVAFAQRDGATVVELHVARPEMEDTVRAQAARLAHSLLDGPAEVVVMTEEGRPALTPALARSRVQLLAVVGLAGEGHVEIHLAYRGRRAFRGCRSGDRVAVAHAVIDCLGELGLRVPFEPTAVQLLPEELGEGALVQLRHPARAGVRRGIAGGRREEEAIARAVLNGLNRYLEAGRHDRLGPGDGAARGLPAAG